MARLRLALVQAASSTDPAENRARLAALVAEAHGEDGVGLVVLPEAFARDFGSPGDDLAPYAEPLDGPFVTALVDAASSHGGAVLAGMFESTPGGRPFNTLVLADAGGVRAAYRKIHLYDSFGYRESERLTAGPPSPLLAEVGGVRVGLMTCYDLRFPEHARQLTLRGAEVLLLPAAWVAGPRKVRHWSTLLAARAIENLAYVAAAAQPPPRYTGHSVLVDPRGDVLAQAAEEPWTVVRQWVDTAEVAAARAENPSLENARL